MHKSINIITSNIRFDNPKDEEHAWPKRKDFLVKTLLDYAPDIIGTQEGRRPQLDELESLLPHMKMVQEHRKWIDKRMYPCLYINSQKVKVLKSKDIWLSETPNIAGSKSFDSAFPRLCVAACLQIERFKFYCFNMHLDHEKESTRLSQAKVILQEAQKFNDQQLPCIFMGDFNTDPKSEIYELFQDHGLVDPWVVHEKPEETSFHRFEGEFDQGKRIDWILHNSFFKSSQIKMIKDHNNHLYPSDHFPVYSKLNY